MKVDFSQVDIAAFTKALTKEAVSFKGFKAKSGQKKAHLLAKIAKLKEQLLLLEEELENIENKAITSNDVAFAISLIRDTIKNSPETAKIIIELNNFRDGPYNRAKHYDLLFYWDYNCAQTCIQEDMIPWIQWKWDPIACRQSWNFIPGTSEAIDAVKKVLAEMQK